LGRSRYARRRVVGLLLVALVVALCASPQFRNIRNLPSEIRLTPGQLLQITVGLPIALSVRADPAELLRLNGRATSFSIEPQALGRVKLSFMLFGVIPVKRMAVEVVPRIALVPGGHSIGVLLSSEGVLVVGHDSILGADGKIHRPALEAGITKGDIIVRIAGRRVSGDEEARDLIDQVGRLGRPVDVEYRRAGQTATCTIRPVHCRDTGRFRVGLLIRDVAAGVGTLTFYDPKTLRYGALGHVVADVDTNTPLTIKDGRIVAATVAGIEQGRKGQPGEKIGTFLEDQDVVGTIDRNTSFGIGGRLTKTLPNSLYSSPLPVALSGEIEEGPAEMVTVVDGERLEKFTVQIQRVLRQAKPDGKGLVIKVTDQRLLSRTGGIVQGMSGSPIIQKGRIIGAVTHVFVNDPSRGYGVLAEWMAAEMGLLGNGQVAAVVGQVY
jgi:stage IV sporulation protein B